MNTLIWGVSRVPPRWALFISGYGSNAQSLLDHLCEIDVRLVVSSRKENFGILKSKRLGIPILHFSKNQSWSWMMTELQSRRIQRIFLLGFMKILPAEFITEFTANRGVLLNVHPSLLPNYPGLNSFERAFEDKKDLGITVHHVVAGVDEGPHVQQEKIKNREFQTLSEAQLYQNQMEQKLVWRSVRVFSHHFKESA